MKLVLPGFSRLDLMETTARPTPLGFPRLIRSRSSAVSISGSCGFCLHSEFWVYSPPLEIFFFCPSPTEAVFTVCVCARMTTSSLGPIDVSPGFLLSQRSTQLLRHPTVCIHFKGGRELDSRAQTAEQPACGFSHSKTLT